jgi:hypothetical protein
MLFAFLSLTLDALTVQNTPWLLSPSCWMCSVIIWVVGMILAVNSRQHLTPSYARYITLVLLVHSMDMPTDAYVSFFLSQHTSRVSESRTWRRASAHSQSQILSHQFYVMPVYFIANRLSTLILNTTMTSRYSASKSNAHFCFMCISTTTQLFSVK